MLSGENWGIEEERKRKGKVGRERDGYIGEKEKKENEQIQKESEGRGGKKEVYKIAFWTIVRIKKDLNKDKKF